MKKDVLSVLIIVCGLFISSCQQGGISEGAPQSRGAQQSGAAATGRGGSNTGSVKEVEVVAAEEGYLAETITITGTLAAQDQITVAMKVPGRIEEINVDFGSKVTKGQVIARLGTTDFQLRVQQAEAAFKQARTRLGLNPEGTDDFVELEKTPLVRQTAAQLEDAQLLHDRSQTMWDRGLLPKSQLDSAVANLRVAQGRYDDSLDEIRNRQAVLSQRKSEVDIARQQLADTVAYAPASGSVRERTVSAGTYVAAGTPIATIVLVHPLRLRLGLPERAAAGARLGQDVRVTVEGESSVFTGKLVRVSPSISEQNRTLMVEAEIPNEKDILRPGAFAKAEITTSEKKPAVFVPSSAISSFAGIEKVTSVKDGKVLELRVKTGRRNGDRVEIVEGLKADTVVIVQPGNLSTGQPVNIIRR